MKTVMTSVLDVVIIVVTIAAFMLAGVYAYQNWPSSGLRITPELIEGSNLSVEVDSMTDSLVETTYPDVPREEVRAKLVDLIYFILDKPSDSYPWYGYSVEEVRPLLHRELRDPNASDQDTRRMYAAIVATNALRQTNFSLTDPPDGPDSINCQVWPLFLRQHELATKHWTPKL